MGDWRTNLIMPESGLNFAGVTPLPPRVVSIHHALFEAPDQAGLSVSVPTSYQLFTSEDAPTPALGTNGDWYIRSGVGILTVYRKIVGVWTIVTSITSGGVSPGTPGVGVPAGGTTGQILSKNSNTDFDTEWADSAAISAALVNIADAAGLFTGTTAETAFAEIGQATAIHNTQAGNYTLALSDAFYRASLLMTSGSANTLTVPPNATIAFPIGSRVPGWTTGAGQTTLTPGAGVTINGRGGALKSAGQYAAWLLEKTATNAWLATGDLMV